MIVLDANILIRAVLGRRVRQLIETYGVRGARFFAPDVAFDDAASYLPPLLKKRGKQDVDVPASLELNVTRDFFSSYAGQRGLIRYIYDDREGVTNNQTTRYPSVKR